MNDPDRETHWQGVYAAKDESEVSWFQEEPAPSIELLERAGAKPDSAIIDVGAGAARLVDRLLSAGFSDITALDLSAAALTAAKARLGPGAAQVRWVVADVTAWRPPRQFDIWHDRAALHFLTVAADQAAYAERLHAGLKAGGRAIIGTFAPDGPERCSGLPVVRHDAGSLARLLGDSFELVDARPHNHVTPWGAAQRFQFSTFRRR